MHWDQFCQFSKNCHFSTIRCFLKLLLVKTTLLNQFDHFVKAIAPALWPILLIFKKLSFFFNIRRFFKPFIAQNNSNVLLQSFFKRFTELLFLNQFKHFVKAIAPALWPISPIFKKFLISGVFWSRFLHRTTPMCFYNRFLHAL